MMREVVEMSMQEIERLGVIERVKARVLSQKAGAEQLGLSHRQLRRLMREYEKAGAAGLISKRRGKPSNNQLKPEVKKLTIELLRSKYEGFGPTLACEYLAKEDQVKLSVESLRTLMIAEGLWYSKARKHVKIHQQRERRSCFGELVQIDGSPHDWFLGRRGKCCLLVFIDDATSKVVWAHFAEEETTEAYFEALEGYLTEYGRPLGFYSDRDSIFRVNKPEAESGSGETQFGRAMRELDIKLICANTPQAKGRVERANQTLQDRLVKDLKLKKISDIQAANRYLPTFLKQFNERFSVMPASAIDAHRKEMPNLETLRHILSHQGTRRISKNLEISYKNICYQLQLKTAHRLRNVDITVCDRKGEITLLWDQKILAYTVFNKNNQPAPIQSAKQIQIPKESAATVHKPKADHPWKKYYPIPEKASTTNAL